MVSEDAMEPGIRAASDGGNSRRALCCCSVWLMMGTGWGRAWGRYVEWWWWGGETVVCTKQRAKSSLD